MCSDDNTRNQICMDAACILVRTKSSMVLNKDFNMKINVGELRIKLLKTHMEHSRSTFQNQWISYWTQRS